MRGQPSLKPKVKNFNPNVELCAKKVNYFKYEQIDRDPKLDQLPTILILEFGDKEEINRDESKLHPIISSIFAGEKLENKLAINKEKCDF